MKETFLYRNEKAIDNAGSLLAECVHDLEILARDFPDATVTVSVSSSAFAKLPKKEAAVKMLNALVHAVKVPVYKDDYVNIDFAAGKALWSGREIHVTASERVALFYYLVMGVRSNEVNAFITNIRKRVGDAFLRHIGGK